MNAFAAKPVVPGREKEFFSQVEDFQANHMKTLRFTRKASWWVAGAFGTMAVLEGAAISVLAPMHEVEYRVIEVNSSTGEVSDATTLKQAPKTINEAVEKYFLAEYVNLREGYSAPAAGYNYHAVALMSDAAEQGRYKEAFRGGNPTSPQVVYANGGYVKVHVETVSILAPNLAQVRFAKEAALPGAQPKTTEMLAQIGFKFEPTAPISNLDRDSNPLGLQVSNYQADQVAPR